MSDDTRVKRRSATAEEIESIVVRTEQLGTGLKGLPAEDRAMLYRVVMTLGPRARECASLIPESFAERDDGLTLIIEASQTKNGKQAQLPVPHALADLLRTWLKGKPTGTKLWPGAWYREAAEMVREDLAAAAVEYDTKAGVLDFHAMRHTAITRGSRVMPLVDLKTFARHAKIETTMRYVHTDEQELRERVEMLPTIGNISARQAAGTARSGKSDHRRDRAGVSKRQVESSSGNEGHSKGRTKNDATPCQGKGLSSKNSDCLQRARRDSNPQPPDRQPSRGVNSSSVNTGDSESAKSKASKNASAPRGRQQMSDDDMLLRVIEAWATLTPARKKMILKLIEVRGSD